ncbi:hypothetical protein [Streptomyces pseudovenezuelae]|uniref:Uncharacterized protein n=1 Tax=Streptomyces pseudovenezuelae TaxID=67350 RepID=A0ABT6LN35_9ACTN|nr:hypothetical protein [Streptomyces pseudovenezuelae]MDH6217728.1 hypothetical protein [Streptomyces pseudovenezuelae]
MEFTVWYREVEDEWPDPDTYIDSLYDAACAELPRGVSQLRPVLSEGDLRRSTTRTVLVGVKHDDTEVQVQLVVVVGESSRCRVTGSASS